MVFVIVGCKLIVELEAAADAWSVGLSAAGDADTVDCGETSPAGV